MIQDLFDTEDKKSMAISAFGSLMQHPGWKLLVQVWEQNIEVLRNQLEEKGDEETLEDVNRLRDKIAIFKENIGKPESIVKSFNPEEVDAPSSDPYPTVASLKKQRGEAT